MSWTKTSRARCKPGRQTNWATLLFTYPLLATHLHLASHHEKVTRTLALTLQTSPFMCRSSLVGPCVPC